MGSLLSQTEHEKLVPYLQGIDPASLATVIWDSINNIGMDSNVKNGVGSIQFLEGDDNQDHAVFWDSEGAEVLPQNVFLEIMRMVGEKTAQTFEDNYDLERSPESKVAVSKLKLSLQCLYKHVSTMRMCETVEEYKNRQYCNDANVTPDLVDDVMKRRGSYTWKSGDENHNTSGSASSWSLLERKDSKGLVGVIDRLPDLQRRGSGALERVKKKLKVISSFKIENAPTEDDYEQMMVEEYSTEDNGDGPEKAASFKPSRGPIRMMSTPIPSNLVKKKHTPITHNFSLPIDIHMSTNSSDSIPIADSNLLSPDSPTSLPSDTQMLANSSRKDSTPIADSNLLSPDSSTSLNAHAWSPR